jgi:hypothetical protein
MKSLWYLEVSLGTPEIHHSSSWYPWDVLVVKRQRFLVVSLWYFVVSLWYLVVSLWYIVVSLWFLVVKRRAVLLSILLIIHLIRTARLFTTRIPQGTTRIPQCTTRYHKDTTRILSFYHKDTPGVPRGTMRYLRGTQWHFKVPQGLPGELCIVDIYMVPQGIPRVLCHVYIRYHKESLEYSAMSI